MNAPMPSRLMQPSEESRRVFPLLGTFVEIAVSSEEQSQANTAIELAFAAMEKIQALMSYHDPDSELSRINRHAASEPVAVGDHTRRVLEAARAFSRISDGLFDITIAPTLTQWGYLPRHLGAAKPSGQGDWRHVELLPGGQVSLARRLRIDLGGIAKGYAVDIGIQALREAGVTAGRINAGGDMRVFGVDTRTVHVRYPRQPAKTLPLLRLENAAVATSAGYFTGRMQRGRWITPLIHPKTRAACGAHRSVSVLASDCMTADALTKVVHADAEKALPVLAHYRARALMLEPDTVPGMLRFSFFDPDEAVDQPRWQVQTRPEVEDA